MFHFSWLWFFMLTYMFLPSSVLKPLLLHPPVVQSPGPILKMLVSKPGLLLLLSILKGVQGVIIDGISHSYSLCNIRNLMMITICYGSFLWLNFFPKFIWAEKTSRKTYYCHWSWVQLQNVLRNCKCHENVPKDVYCTRILLAIKIYKGNFEKLTCHNPVSAHNKAPDSWSSFSLLFSSGFEDLASFSTWVFTGGRDICQYDCWVSLHCEVAGGPMIRWIKDEIG